MTDEEHDDLHDEAAEAVHDLLTSYFDDPSCRAAVLLGVLGVEILDMTEVEDLQDVFGAMSQLMLDRILQDQKMFDTQGSA